MELKPLFFILVLIALLLTPGCLEGNNTITPPFTTNQFVRQATDLNYADWKAGDYNNMVLVFDGNKISVADANDLNVALPDLSVYVPYQGTTQDVNLGEHNLRASGLFGNYFGIQSLAVASEAIGGVITYDGNYVIHTFKSSGTFFSPQNISGAEVLVVAGGGGGGGTIGGGGGAGGLIHNLNYNITSGNKTVTVGAGGNGGIGWNYQPSAGSQGSNSVFDTLTAIGGGGGGAGPYTAGSGGGGGNGIPSTGGSGGGAGYSSVNGASGTSGQGHDGGNSADPYAGGGGGGSEDGEDATTTTPANGGDGILINISGTAKYYAGGGGGGARSTQASAGNGGLGGGGNGSTSPTGATSGTANTGGGGGGAGYNQTQSTAIQGGTGGSGIVIIRYLRLNSTTPVDKNITFDSNNFVFDGGGKFNGDLNIDGNLSVGRDIFVNDFEGLDLNARIVKDTNYITSTSVYCDMNFVSGILVSSDC